MSQRGRALGAWLVAAAVVVGVLFVAGRRSPRQTTPEGTPGPLRIAMSGLYPPFNFFDEENKLVGFDVDIAREIGRRLGREPELTTTAWDGILAGLVAGKYDLIIGSMAITPERKESVSFSDPYYVSGAQMIARKGSPIKGPDDLKGKVVGVTLGETYEQRVRKIPGVKRVATYKGGVPNLLMELENKRIDALVSDRLVGLYAIQLSGSDVVLAGDFLYKEEMGIALRKGETELQGQVNAALAEMRADGTYSRISEEWFGRDILALDGGDAEAATGEDPEADAQAAPTPGGEG